MDFRKKPPSPEQQRIQAAIGSLLAARDASELTQFIQSNPFVLEDSFMGGLEQILAQARQAKNVPVITLLEQRLAVLRDVSAQVNAEARQPFIDALMAFLSAPSDLAARQIYLSRRDRLVHPEAQRLLTEAFKTEDAASQQRIDERRELLARLMNEEMDEVAKEVEAAGPWGDAWRIYEAAQEVATSRPTDLASWEQAAAAGERLLAPELAHTPTVDHQALGRQLSTTWNNLGGVHMAEGRWEEALRAFTRASELDPERGQWYCHRAFALLRLGRLDEAYQIAERARELDPEADWGPRLASELKNARMTSRV